MRRGARWPWLFVALATTRAAFAGEPDTDDVLSDEPAAVMEGRLAFVRGTELARQGQWVEALAEFERSAERRPHPVTTYNVGFSERALGRVSRARMHFRAALSEHADGSSGELPAELSSAANEYLAELALKIVRLQVTLTPPDAAISVDGRPLEAAKSDDGAHLLVAGTSAPGKPARTPAPRFALELDPGIHTFELTHGTAPSSFVRYEARLGEDQALGLAWAEPGAPRPSSAQPAPIPAPTSTRQFAVPAYATLSVGGLLALTAVGTGVAYHLSLEDLSGVCFVGLCPSDRADQIAQANALGTATWIVASTGAAAMGVGAILLALEPSSDARSTALWIAPGSLRLVHRF